MNDDFSPDRFAALGETEAALEIAPLQDAARRWTSRVAPQAAALAADIAAAGRPFTGPSDHVAVMPTLLPRSQYRGAFGVAQTLVRLAAVAAQRLAPTPRAFAELLGRPDDEFPIVPGRWLAPAREVISARPDCVFSGGRMHVIELNCHSAVGAVNILWAVSPVMAGRLESLLGLPPIDRADPFAARLAALTDITPSTPRIVVLGWLDDPIVVDPRYFTDECDYHHEHGIDSTFVSVEQLRDEGIGSLTSATAVLRTGMTSDWLPVAPGALDEMGARVRADSQAAQSLVVSDTAELLEDKALLHHLSAGAILTPAERAATERVLPWTRLVTDGRTADVDGESADLLEFVARSRDRLVLKPCWGRQGEGVVAGVDVDGATWDATIQHIVTSGERWVAQRFLRSDALHAAYVATATGELRTAMGSHVISPYLFGDHFGGCLSRFTPKEDGHVIAANRGSLQSVAMGV